MSSEDFSTPYWLQQIAELERTMGLPIPDNFLQNAIIRHTMFADDPNDQWPTELLNLVVDHFGYERTLDLVVEPTFGFPHQKTYWSSEGPVFGSHNNIQQLAHVAQFEKVVPDLVRPRVVEWGGGFGNMARLISQMYNPASYEIVDLPYMNEIQRAYLDKAEVNAATTSDPDQISDMDGVGVFISTWALSECNRSAMEYVVERKFFGASHFLMAAQQPNDLFENADDLQWALETCGFTPTTVQFRSGATDIYILG